MEDPQKRTNPPSPISILLQNMGLTRDDLAQRAEQMRSFLDTDTTSHRALSQQSDSQESSAGTEIRPRQRSRTGSASVASNHRPSTSPSPSPVKSEPVDKPLPPRQMDTMHIVMERKRRQMKRDRKGSVTQSREPTHVSQPPLTSSSDSLSSQTDSQTPHHYKYYSDRVIGTAVGSQFTFDSTLSPQTPTRKGRHPFKSAGTPNRDPRTPIGRHIYSLTLPPSSRASSPTSSPSRIVNLVSSPGPMRHLPPDDEDTDDLPFTLPPGPYSTTKPDYSYAAMIGQAIISSPEHRLPLQDIYEYITTVYPYYKRGEQTWMNSVRHALSTMAVFRKVPRGKMEGKSLWAILDCDLPCFAHGGFRKSLCADMMKQKAEAAAKSGPKKRGTMDETIARNAKRRKKSTNSNHTSEGQVHHYNSSEITTQVHTFPPMFAAGPAIGVGPPVLPPFYAAVLPGSHHQPYYPAYVPQPVPAEVIFPPLPPSSGYHRIANFAATQQQHASVARASSVDEPSSESALPPSSDSGLFESDDHEGDDGSVKGKGKGKGKSKEVTPPPDSDSPTAPTSSSSGAPGLTPNGSSDSSPTMSSEASAVGAEVPSDAESFVGAPRVVGVEDDEFEEWLKEDPGVDDGGEGGGYRLLKEVSAKKEKEKLSGSVRRLPTKLSPFAVPVSPTLERRVAMGKQKEKERAKECEKEKLPPKSKSTKKSPPPSPIFRTSSSTSSTTRLFRPTTPPPRPCTPPRRPGTSIQLSPQRTPISHRGLHMSPSPSLAHYKNNLDPPPPVASVFLPQAPLLCGGVVSQGAVVLPSPEVLRTPKRKGGRVSIGSAGKGMSIGALVDPGTFAPVTPKRVFSSSTSSSSNLSHSNPHSRSSKSSASSTLHESASSTSTGVSTQLSPATWDSPFRTTPSKMQIFDPHDPGTLLDDEVMRLGTQQDMSPCGSGIGRERGLLYESPSLDGVGWERYW